MSKDKSGGNGDIPVKGPKLFGPLGKILARGRIEAEQEAAEERRRERFERRWGSGKPKGPEPKGGEERPKK